MHTGNGGRAEETITVMEKAVLDSAIIKLEMGMSVKKVRGLTGIPTSIIYQLKREVKVNDLGCVVCGRKRELKNYCRKHYFRYRG